MQDCRFQQQQGISMELEVIVICWFTSAAVKKIEEINLNCVEDNIKSLLQVISVTGH